MPHRAFFAFILPSLASMIVFIAMPLISIAWQSLYVEHPKVLTTVETCDPFGCELEPHVDIAAMTKLNAAEPAGLFNGLATFADTSHLAFSELRHIWQSSPNIAAAFAAIVNLRFYNALLFTLAFTFIVTPGALVLGLAIALAVDVLPKALRGTITYITLLPMIVPSLIGALVLFWMMGTRGIIGTALQALFDDPDLSVLGSVTLTRIALFIYGIWSSAPYVFLIFYAGLQTVPKETLESAMVDGASAWARFRHVVWPHLRPLAVFLLIVNLMDNFRVFETIIGFNAVASASSLSVLIFQDLHNGDSPLFGSAAATSMLTIFGIALLLTPSMLRSWSLFRQKA